MRNAASPWSSRSFRARARASTTRPSPRAAGLTSASTRRTERSTISRCSWSATASSGRRPWCSRRAATSASSWSRATCAATAKTTDWARPRCAPIRAVPWRSSAGACSPGRLAENGSQMTDLVVVGCGIAGMSAAVTALQAGLEVVLLERAPEEDFGGNSRWTEAYLRMKNDSEISDDFEERFAQNAGVNLDPNVLDAVAGEYAHWPPFVKAHALPDPELIAHFASSVPPTIAWLKSFGLRFGPQPIYLLTQSTTRIAAQGGGLALIERLMKEARALGVDVRFRTTAVGLLRASDGRIEGVRVIDPEGRHAEIRGRATLLASGGFQGNPEMMAHYMGDKAARIRPVARGGYYNKGEGIRMALEAGAAPAGGFASYHAAPVDPRSRHPEAVVHIYPSGILVNKLGLRFVNEGPGMVDAHYDPITRTIAEQPDGIAWVVFDAKVEEIRNWKTS